MFAVKVAGAKFGGGQSLPCAKGGGRNLRFRSEGLLGHITITHVVRGSTCPKQSPSHLLVPRKCQLAAASPVAALTVHRTVIHYRDCASLTLYTRGPLRSGQNRITHLRVMRGTENYTRIERSLALGVRENRWMDSHRIRAPRAAHRAKIRSILWAPQSWQIKPAVEEDTSPPMAVAEAK